MCSRSARRGIPRHFAGASLKLGKDPQRSAGLLEYSPAFRWGLIEAYADKGRIAFDKSYSPAFRWGLIEAPPGRRRCRRRRAYSPAFRWGLIEAGRSRPRCSACPGYSPAFRWGLIEARTLFSYEAGAKPGIPRHFAGASLKPVGTDQADRPADRVFPGISLGPH